MALVSIDDIRRAAAGLVGVTVHTPLVPAYWAGNEFFVKPESLQPIGSFKLRGGYHAIASLPEPSRAAGVVTHSSGNHAQAVEAGGDIRTDGAGALAGRGLIGGHVT